MSYIFDVSSETNDLAEVDHFVRYIGYGDYLACNRRDADGNTIYNVVFTDKRYALQFKLKFNATLIKWDESDDEEIVTIEDLKSRGYVEMKISVDFSRSEEFRQWCGERDFPIVDEFKFIYSNNLEPITLYVPESQQALVKLTWG